MSNEDGNQVLQLNNATRLELMAEFREAMKAADPAAVVGDGVIHPSFKLKPEEFKFAQSQYLFTIWLSGRGLRPDQTISGKEQLLKSTVAMPEATDWRLLADSPAALADLDAMLVSALQFAKSGEATWGDIANQIFPALEVIGQKYPELGITDSEVHETIARFFAINFAPAMYEFMRYYNANECARAGRSTAQK